MAGATPLPFDGQPLPFIVTIGTLLDGRKQVLPVNHAMASRTQVRRDHAVHREPHVSMALVVDQGAIAVRCGGVGEFRARRMPWP